MSESFENIIGRSHRMREIFRLIEQVAPTQATVLVAGESGTGKELVARAIHRRGTRAEAPFVTVSCAALPETLLESELFGHERGAFTGAIARRPGRFEFAAGGTLFLDEVGEIPASMQVKLLRFLQERQFERVGGNETLSVDVRLIAATHRDLAALVRDGSFRDDLYYRLNVIQILVPALRKRPEDIPLLASAFVRRHAAQNHKEILGITDEALGLLMRHAWPGNVREMEHAIERAVVLAPGPWLDADLFPALEPPSVEIDRRGGAMIPGSTLDAIEKEAILRTLEAVGGSTSRAAAILGISPRTVQYRIKRYRAG